MHREDSLRRPFLSSSEHDDSAVEGHEESPVGEDHDVREGSPLQVEGEGVFLATSGSHLSESSEFSSFRSRPQFSEKDKDDLAKETGFSSPMQVFVFSGSMIVSFTTPVWTLFLINLTIFQQDDNHEQQLTPWELAVQFFSVAFPIGMMLWLVFAMLEAASRHWIYHRFLQDGTIIAFAKRSVWKQWIVLIPLVVGLGLNLYFVYYSTLQLALFSSIILQAHAVLQIYKEKFASLDSQLLSLNSFVSREPSRAADFLNHFWVLTEEELLLWKQQHNNPVKNPDPWLTPAKWVYHQRKAKGVDFLTKEDFSHTCNNPLSSWMLGTLTIVRLMKLYHCREAVHVQARKHDRKMWAFMLLCFFIGLLAAIGMGGYGFYKSLELRNVISDDMKPVQLQVQGGASGISAGTSSISVNWANPKLENSPATTESSASTASGGGEPPDGDGNSMHDASLVSNAMARVWSADPDVDSAPSNLLATAFGTGSGGSITIPLPASVEGDPGWLYVTVEGFTADMQGSLRSAPRSSPIRVPRAYDGVSISSISHSSSGPPTISLEWESAPFRSEWPTVLGYAVQAIEHASGTVVFNAVVDGALENTLQVSQGLQYGTQYNFQVAVLSQASSVEGSRVQGDWGPSTSAYTVPFPSPQNFAVQSLAPPQTMDPSVLTFSWDSPHPLVPSTPIPGYKLQLYSSTSHSFVSSIDVAPNPSSTSKTTFRALKLAAATWYTAQVHVGGGMQFRQSASLERATSFNAPTVSVLPVVGEQSLRVSWVVRDATDSEESPKVTSISVRYREENSQGQYETAVGIAPTDNSINVSDGIQYQRSYSVQVAVLSQFDAQGTSVQGPWSEVVQGEPLQYPSPTQLTSIKSAATIDTLTFTWSAPFQQSPIITQYCFKFGTRPQDVKAGTGSTMFKQVSVGGGTSASVTLDSLSQGVDYFAQVAISETSDGPAAGLFSSIAEGTTLLGPPTGIQLSPQPRAIAVSWTADMYDAFQISSILSGFQARISADDEMNKDPQQHSVDSSTLATTFTGLNAGWKYYVQVCTMVAGNTKCGPWSSIVEGAAGY